MKLRFVALCGPFLAAVFAVLLTPSSALADANPNNHGHHYHYGWTNHHSPPAPAPAPAPAPRPGGGPVGSGPQNAIVAVVPVALAPQAPTATLPDAPVGAPSTGLVTSVQPLQPGRDAWLVAIILASVLAANVTLAVLVVGRGGHYAMRRVLSV